MRPIPTWLPVDPTEPAVCALTAGQARDLACELLAMAEHAEQLTRDRDEGR